MKLLEQILMRKKLVLTLVFLLSASGAVLWVTMVRQEDPRLPDFWGQVVSLYPGADAETVENLILEPIEDALAEVDEIKIIEATALEEVALLTIELRGDTDDINLAWDDVREALEKAQQEFPAGAGRPVLDEDQQDQESVVLAITGSSDLLVLLNAARIVKDELLALHSVSRVNLISNPGEQVTVDLDDHMARRLNIGANQLATRLGARNHILPGGSLKMNEKTVRLRPLSEFSSLKEIEATSVVLSSGNAIPLGEIARVHLGPKEPATSRMRFNGEMSVGLAIVPRKAVNLVSFGEAVRKQVQATALKISPLVINEVTFQPKRTETRLKDLSRSLFFGILIVAGVLILTMGIRLGMVAAVVVPLVAMISLAIFAWSGGVLHQISIAALVLALGMLVDNAIVIAENVQWRLDRGIKASQAALEAVRELAVPLAGATATTLAAFIPMLIAEGPTAAFTRSIPIVMMLTLSVSYFFAIFVTPILAQTILVTKPANVNTTSERIGKKIARIAVQHSGIVMIATVLLVGASLIASGSIRQQFFPTSDRNQLIIQLKLVEGTHLDSTDKASRTLEKALADRPEVTSTASFMGRSAPKFYYNIKQVPFSPHLAQLIVETKSKNDIESLLIWIRAFVEENISEVEVVAKKLEQGPPVDAPIEIRLFGSDLEKLNTAAIKVSRTLREIPGTKDVRHDLGPGAPAIQFQIDDAAASRFGLTRADLAQTLYGRTRGLSIGELHIGDDPIPVVVRSSAGENLPIESLESIDIPAPDGRLIPLGQIARLNTVWRPAAIKHRDTRRVVTVSSQLAEDFTFSDVMNEFQKNKLNLPIGVDIGFGGEIEGSGEANMALMNSFPIGLLILFGVLLAEFNSFRRMAIILITVPLAAAGVVPGLIIGNQPFGFTSLLGVIALVGIVVNNAIVLLEVIEARRKEGATLNQALEDAVARRIRPILLTSATTVAGLIPLAFSSSTLWPPLAYAMISGLIASTMLTLVVVPALYRILFSPFKVRFLPVQKQATQAMILFLVVMSPLVVLADAPMYLELREAMELGQKRPLVEAAKQRALAADIAVKMEKNLAFLPTAAASTSAATRDRNLYLVTPLGKFPYSEQQRNSAGVKLVQPLFNPVRLFYSIPAAKAEAKGQHLQSERIRQLQAYEAGQSFLNVLGIDTRINATKAFVENLSARLSEIEVMVIAGRALEADALKVRLAYEQAMQELLALNQYRTVALASLERAVNYNGHVEPHPVSNFIDYQIPQADEAIQTAIRGRPDLGALRMAAKALKKKKGGVLAELWPQIEASGTWNWNDGSPYSEDQWVEGEVTITWTPFAGGSRRHRAGIFSAQHAALKADLREALSGVTIEVKSAIAALETARGAISVEKRGVQKAKETLRVEREQHRKGRATTNDLLEAEAQLRERGTMLEIARLEVVRSWIELWLATGNSDLPSQIDKI